VNSDMHGKKLVDLPVHTHEEEGYAGIPAAPI